jgi:predicted CopG family antitoxin
MRIIKDVLIIHEALDALQHESEYRLKKGDVSDVIRVMIQRKLERIDRVRQELTDDSESDIRRIVREEMARVRLEQSPHKWTNFAESSVDKPTIGDDDERNM